MKRVFLVMSLLAGSAIAQFTTVTGTVTDPNGLPYAYGTIASAIVSSGTPTFTSSGQLYYQPSQATGLDANGKFLVRLGDNTTLSPGGSTWTFTVCSAQATVFPAFGLGPVCFVVAGITISGSSQDIGTTLRAAAPALTVNFGGGVGGTITGSGNAGIIPLFTTSTSIGNSDISDSIGSSITAGTGTPLTGTNGFKLVNSPNTNCANSVATFPFINSNQGCHAVYGFTNSGSSATGTVAAGTFENVANNGTATLQLGVTGLVMPAVNAATHAIGVYGECNQLVVMTLTDCRGVFGFAYNSTVTTLASNDAFAGTTGIASALTTTKDAVFHALAPFQRLGTMTQHVGFLADAPGIGVGFQSSPEAFSTLPACSSTYDGSTQAVLDSSASTVGTTITGGGSFHVLGYCNGTNWVVSGSNSPSTAVQASSTTLLAAPVALSGTTTILTKAVTMPASGCPCRAFVAYSINFDGTNSGEMTLTVSDGSATFATNSFNQTGSATDFAVPGGAYSTGTYANGANITFTLLAATTMAGTTNAHVGNANGLGQASWMNVAILPSN